MYHLIFIYSTVTLNHFSLILILFSGVPLLWEKVLERLLDCAYWSKTFRTYYLCECVNNYSVLMVLEGVKKIVITFPINFSWKLNLHQERKIYVMKYIVNTFKVNVLTSLMRFRIWIATYNSTFQILFQIFGRLFGSTLPDSCPYILILRVGVF